MIIASSAFKIKRRIRTDKPLLPGRERLGRQASGFRSPTPSAILPRIRQISSMEMVLPPERPFSARNCTIPATGSILRTLPAYYRYSPPALRASGTKKVTVTRG